MNVKEVNKLYPQRVFWRQKEKFCISCEDSILFTVSARGRVVVPQNMPTVLG